MPGTSLREIRLPGLQGVPPVLAAPGSEWHFCTGSLLCLDIIVLFRSHLYVASPPEAGRKENLLPHHTHTQPRDNPVPAIVASFSSRQGPDNACPILVIAVGSHAPHTHIRISSSTCTVHFESRNSSPDFPLLARFQSNFDLLSSPLLRASTSSASFLTNRQHLLRKASLD